MKKILFTIALFLVSGHFAFAATYYIDYASGSDSNNGTSTSTPWKRQPYMEGFTGSYSHSAGDKFIFKGGVSWPNIVFPIIPANGGSVSAQDYYGVDKTYFTGGSWTRPIFDSQGMVVGSTTDGKNDEIELNNNDAGYITFDNIEFKGHYWTGSYGFGQNITILSGWSGFEGTIIENCYFHGWTHAPYNNGSTSDTYGMIQGNSTEDDSSNQLLNNTFSGADGDSQSGDAVYQWGVISGNVIHDMSNALVGIANIVSGNTIYNINVSYDPDVHENTIETWLGIGSTTQYIYNNVMHDSAGYNPVNALLPNTSATTSLKFYYYNNVMWNITYGIPLAIDNNCIGQCYPTQVTDHIWNNTIVASSSNQCMRFVNRGYGNLGVLDMENNHCISNTGLLTVDAGISANSTTSIDNLLESTTTATSQGYTIANQFQPTSATSPTVSTGANLTSQNIFTTDILGVPRPASGAWDVGAYQFVTGILGGFLEGVMKFQGTYNI